MKTFLVFILSALSIFAADPAQPKVGVTPVINATNGYGGTLTIRTQLNVGYPLQTGVLTLSDNGTVFTTINGLGNASFGGGIYVFNSLTNAALQPLELVFADANRVLGSVAPGNAGDVLTSAGAGVAPSFGPPTGTTINPTNLRIPARTNATTFINSPFQVIPSRTNAVGFNSGIAALYDDGVGANIGFGEIAFSSLTTGSQNTAFGGGTSTAITSGIGNSIFGYGSGGAISSTHFNIVLGDFAYNSGPGGFDNIVAGDSAWSITGGGSYNIVMGASAFSQGTGSQNVIIGDNAGGASLTRNNSIAIGALTQPIADNTANIGTNITALYLNGTVGWFRGSGSPEGVITAPPGSFYSNESGGTNTIWVKQIGTGNIGWAAMNGSSGGGGGSGGTVGTMINTASTVAGNVAYALDTSITNWAPSPALTLGATTNATFNGSLALSSQTNLLSISGGQLLLDGSPIGGSGVGIWSTNANGTLFANTTASSELSLAVTNTTNAVIQLGPSGSLYLGPNSLQSFEGGSPNSADQFVSIHDTSKGDSPNWDNWFGATYDGNYANGSHVEITGSTNSAFLIEASGVWNWTLNTRADDNPGALRLKATRSGSTLIDLNPIVESDGTHIPIILGTLSLTNGVLASFEEGSNSKLQVMWNGALKPYNITADRPTRSGVDGTLTNGLVNLASTNEVTGSPLYVWKVYNVKDPAYGATGNGTTDDTAAIQAAINACDNADGGTVYFPNGTYKITGTNGLVVANANGSHGGQHYVNLLGESAVSTVLSYAGPTNGFAVVLRTEKYTSIQNMTISRSGARGTTAGLLLTGPNSGTQTSGGFATEVIFSGWHVCIDAGPDSGFSGTSSEWVFNSVQFNSSDMGFANFDYNGLNFIFNQLQCASVATNVWGETAGITINGGSFSSCGTGLFARNGGLFSIKNVRAESAGGPLVDANTTVVIENCMNIPTDTNTPSLNISAGGTISINESQLFSKIVCTNAAVLDMRNTGVYDSVAVQLGGTNRLFLLNNYQTVGQTSAMQAWFTDQLDPIRTGSNPSASVGLSAVNGSAATYMRSDAAPALSQSITPTWTGAHIFSPSSGTPITVTGPNNTTALTVNGGSVTGSGTTPTEIHSGTWNSSGSPIFRRNIVTNTASGASARIETWETDAGEKVSIDKNGKITSGTYGGDSGFISGSVSGVSASGMIIGRSDVGNVLFAGYQSKIEVTLAKSGFLGWSANDYTGDMRSFETGFSRESLGVIQMGEDAATVTNQKIKAHDGSGTDKTGANLTIAGGQGTGTGPGGAVSLQTAPFSTTGSSANAHVDRYIVAPEKTVTDAATSIFEIALPTLKAATVIIKWGLEASDASDVQAFGGETIIAVINKAGTYTSQVTTTTSKAVSGGSTQTGTWSVLDGTNKETIQFTPNGSLTETTYKLFFTIENNSRQAITLL